MADLVGQRHLALTWRPVVSKTSRKAPLGGEDRSLLLDVKEVARLLCLGERTVWRLSGGGMLPKPISIGRSRRWHRKVIEAFVIGKGQENPKK